MNPNLNLIVCILDRSGSMLDLRDEAIGGFNRFLDEQRALPGEAKLTLVLFDDEYLLIHNFADISTVPALNDTTYVPRGMTALEDAVGQTIDDIGKRLEGTPDSERPAQVIVAILTDGLENASKRYTRAKVAQMIAHQQEKYGWQFIFLGANMDAQAIAHQHNIPVANAATFEATAVGTRAAYDTISSLTTSYRVGN